MSSRPEIMTETRNHQWEEMRTNQAQQFEEQNQWNLRLKQGFAELKSLIVELAMRQQSPTSPLNASSPGEASSPTTNRAAPSPHLAAHQLFDELLNPQNCIEHEPCVELSKYNGQGVFEMAGDMSQDLVDGDHDRSTEEVLEVDGDLSQVLVAHHVLEEMPQPTKTIDVGLIDELTKDDDDDDLFELASWIEEDCEPPSYAKGYMRLMCFDPGGEEHKNWKVFECAVDADTVVTSADAERGEENGVHSDEAYEGDETIADEMVNEKLDLLHISDANTSSEVLYVTKDGDMTEANSMSLISTVVYLEIKIMVDDSCLIVVDNMSLVFDPGGVVDHGRYRFDSSYAAGLVHIWSELVW